MSFVDVCRRVAELAQAANAEAEQLRREVGFGDELVVSAGDPRWEKLTAAARPERDALRTFLLSQRLQSRVPGFGPMKGGEDTEA